MTTVQSTMSPEQERQLIAARKELQDAYAVTSGLTDKAQALVDQFKVDGIDILHNASAMSRVQEAFTARDRESANAQRLQDRVNALMASIVPVTTSTWLPSFTLYTAALSGGTGPSGGFLVPPDHKSTYYDRLRAQSVFLDAGPQVLDTTSNVVRVPKIGTSGSAAFVAENAPITPTDPTFEQVELEPKKLAALVLASNESLGDSNPALREVVARDLEREMGLTLDRSFLFGDPAVVGQEAGILGVTNAAGINKTPLATNGRTPTLDDVATALEEQESANARGRKALFMHPRTWGTFRRLKDNDLRYQLQPVPSLEAQRQLFGVPVFLSSQIPIDLTVGTSTDTSWIALVDMEAVVVARREELRVEFDASYKFGSDQTAIRTISRWDVGVIHNAGVRVLTGVRP